MAQIRQKEKKPSLSSHNSATERGLFHSSAILVFALLAVVFTSGCIHEGVLPPGISGAVQPSRSTLDQGVTNLVTVDNVRTLPVNQVLPDTSLRLFMSVVSHDVDPSRPVQNIAVELFDAGVFRSTMLSTPHGDKPFCNQARSYCLPNGNVCAHTAPCTLRAGETKALEFNMVSPTLDQIANIITQVNLNFRVNYDFTGSTNYDILLVRTDEILRLEQEGRSLSVSVQDTKGAGPIKIDVSLFTPYVISDAQQPADAFIVFKARNAGQGALKDNNITEMTIDFPKDLFSGQAGGQYFAEGDRPRQFTCNLATVSGIEFVRCSSQPSSISLFRSESDPLQFIIRKVPQIDVPHKSFTINARADYTYELRSSARVTVTPPQRA